MAPSLAGAGDRRQGQRGLLCQQGAVPTELCCGSQRVLSNDSLSCLHGKLPALQGTAGKCKSNGASSASKGPCRRSSVAAEDGSPIFRPLKPGRQQMRLTPSSLCSADAQSPLLVRCKSPAQGHLRHYSSACDWASKSEKAFSYLFLGVVTPLFSYTWLAARCKV